MSGAAPIPEEPTDEVLVAAWQAGDEEAFAILYERYRGAVLGYAWRMVRRREVAEEVCVEVFVKVLEGRWRPTGRFRAYLFTCAHRLCVDRIRRRGRWDRVLSLLRAAAPVAGDTPEAAAVEDERVRRLEEAVAALPEGHRSALLLYYGQGLPSREVAEILGITDQQLRSRLSYARQRLRTTMVSDEEVP